MQTVRNYQCSVSNTRRVVLTKKKPSDGPGRPYSDLVFPAKAFKNSPVVGSFVKCVRKTTPFTTEWIPVNVDLEKLARTSVYALYATTTAK